MAVVDRGVRERLEWARRRVESRPLGADVPHERLGRYRSYGELLDAWAALADAGARLDCLGESAGGQPLFALEVGPADAGRLALVLSGIHAMEWIGVETGMALFGRLVAEPPADRRVAYVPVVNPDGYLRAESDLRARRRRFVRANANGVDLNRNWPTHWRSVKWEARLLPCLGGPGTAPRSEPEVDAICAKLEAWHRAGVAVERALSLHSFGRMLLLPYGGRWRRPTRFREHLDAARAMHARIGDGRHRIRQSARWVPGLFAHGMEIDHLLEAFGALSLLVECSSGGLRLHDPTSWWHPWRWFNPPDPERTVDGLVTALEAFVRGT
ncbi:MAG: M14 family metallopeptidase [Myxococcota bacterium]|nr:M14 family metallopeptidase [Myxococcota bacterium]